MGTPSLTSSPFLQPSLPLPSDHRVKLYDQQGQQAAWALARQDQEKRLSERAQPCAGAFLHHPRHPLGRTPQYLSDEGMTHGA